MSGGKEFSEAVKQGDVRQIEQLLGHGTIDINGCFYEPAYIDRFNAKDCSALMIASEMGHYEVAKLLLDKGAEMDVRDGNGWPALIFATKEGRGGLIEVLNTLVEPIASDISELVEEIPSGKPEDINRNRCRVAKLLLERGAKIDLVDMDGRSALLHASSEGFYDMVKLLLESGAQVDLQDNDGWCALTLAGDCYKGRERYHELVKGLKPICRISRGVRL